MTDGLLLALAALVLVVVRAAYKRAHPIVHCRCGVILGRAPRIARGSQCASCRYREERDAEARRQMEAAWRCADREYAAAESARIEGRFPVRRAGTFGVVGGSFVLDGWVFEDPRAISDTAAPTATVPQQLTLSRWSVVYGWRLDELHAEAHGAFCSCLNS